MRISAPKVFYREHLLLVRLRKLHKIFKGAKLDNIGIVIDTNVIVAGLSYRLRLSCYPGQPAPDIKAFR
jgi:hypothetical protein